MLYYWRHNLLASIPPCRQGYHLYGWYGIHVLLPHSNWRPWFCRGEESSNSSWDTASHIHAVQYDNCGTCMLPDCGRDSFWETEVQNDCYREIRLQPYWNFQ